MQYVRPHTFAGAEGVQFEFSFAAKSNDIEYRALATAAVMNGRLRLIIFTAPRLHYFDHLKPEIDGIISTAQTIQDGAERPSPDQLPTVAVERCSSISTSSCC